MKNCAFCEKELHKQKTYCSRDCLKLGYKGRKHSEESLKKMRGRKLSQETISKQNKAKTREKVRIEGEFSCILCDKKFTSNTSLRAHMSYCSISGTESVEKCEVCNASFKSKRSLLIHKSLKHGADDLLSELRRKMVEAKKKCSFRRSSIAEDEFFNQVNAFFPDAVRNFMIPGCSHVYDIYIPSSSMIIEFDGDFWHGNKKLYTLSDRMKKQFRLDESNSAKAISSGYKIVRVWQSESSTYIENLKHDNLKNSQD